MTRSDITHETPANASGSDPALDAGMLDGLQRARPALLARLIAAYLEHAPKTLAGMNAAAAAGSVDAVRMAAHSLKSSSASLGAKPLSELFRTLEKQAGAGGDATAIGSLVAQIGREYARVQAALEGYGKPADQPADKPAVRALAG